MSTLALAPLLRDRVGGEPTLDDLIAGVWEGLSAHRAVGCPVCTGEMQPINRAAEPAAGRCQACGAALA